MSEKGLVRLHAVHTVDLFHAHLKACQNSGSERDLPTMYTAVSLVLTILINQSFYAVVLALHWWDARILYHGIHPIYPFGLLFSFSLASWLPFVLENRQFTIRSCEQTALFICLRTNTSSGVHKLDSLPRILYPLLMVYSSTNYQHPGA